MRIKLMEDYKKPDKPYILQIKNTRKSSIRFGSNYMEGESPLPPLGSMASVTTDVTIRMWLYTMWTDYLETPYQSWQLPKTDNGKEKVTMKSLPNAAIGQIKQ